MTAAATIPIAPLVSFYTGRRWFHGTTAALAVGDRLVPGEQVNKDNFPGMDNSWGVWITPRRELAARYGPFVYEVSPEGDVTDWADENGWDRTADNDEFVCDSARVVALHGSATA